MAKGRVNERFGPLGVSQALYKEFLSWTASILYLALSASFPVFFDLWSFLDIRRGVLGVFIHSFLSGFFATMHLRFLTTAVTALTSLGAVAVPKE